MKEEVYLNAKQKKVKLQIANKIDTKDNMIQGKKKCKTCGHVKFLHTKDEGCMCIKQSKNKPHQIFVCYCYRFKK